MREVKRRENLEEPRDKWTKRSLEMWDDASDQLKARQAKRQRFWAEDEKSLASGST